MDVLQDDVKSAFRSLRRSPAFVAIAVLSLGLAIAADTAVFSVVDAILVRPLPFADPSRLVSVRGTVSYAEVSDLRDQARTLEGIGSYGYLPLDLTGGGEPVQVRAAVVTGGLFEALGVRPAFGRWLTAQDDAPGADPAVLVSDAFWRAHLGADRAALGRSLMLSSRPYTLVGVMPPGFGLPTGESQVWITMQVAYAESVRMALGARARSVQQLVVTQGARLALFGVALGVPVSLAVARVLGSLLYGVAPTDPLTHVAAATAVFALALVASWVPAWRASRIDPMIALRAE